MTEQVTHLSDNKCCFNYLSFLSFQQMGFFKNKYRIESSRLKEWDYSTPWWYYVTVCTKGMKEWFGNVKGSKMILNECGEIVKEEWLKTKETRKNVDLDYFVIMPNHLHGIVIIEGPEYANNKNNPTVVETHRRCVSNTNQQETDHRSVSTKTNNLGSIILQFKSVCTKRIRKTGYTSFKWQTRFYDHIIRNEKDLYRVRKYIDLNPLKWSLGEDDEYE
ncbi:MAG TPA: hypothetical protein VKA26_14370 [Ignavibacteriaceae bacterium]|nr:hypothetical protein [Ignavibacteriaceae bacterium]